MENNSIIQQFTVTRDQTQIHSLFYRKQIPTQIWPSSPLRVGIKIVTPNNLFNLIQSQICLDSRSQTTIGGGRGLLGFLIRAWSNLMIIQTELFVNPFATHTCSYFWCLQGSVTNQKAQISPLSFHTLWLVNFLHVPSKSVQGICGQRVRASFMHLVQCPVSSVGQHPVLLSNSFCASTTGVW